MVIQNGAYTPRNTDDPMEDFDLTISYGSSQVSLNDGVNFVVDAADFGNRTVQRRKIEVNSAFYDGTFTIHSTKENITEAIGVQVTGYSQNGVTENLLLLEELFSQSSYTITLRMEDHQETWSCFVADYSIDRSHVNMHNSRALFKAQVPRLPQATYEVVM